MKESNAPTFAQETPTFSLALASPHPVIDVFVQSELEASMGNRTGRANPLGGDNTETISREENFGRVLAALAISHPFGTHVPPFWSYVHPIEHHVNVTWMSSLERCSNFLVSLGYSQQNSH